jgi:hypothetical protein
MKLPKPVFLVSISVFFGAVVVSSGACSSSSGTGTPTKSNPPTGTTFIGGTFGTSCPANAYVQAGTGWAFCDDGTWAYTTSDPSADGFEPYSPPAGDAGHEDAGIEASPLQDATADAPPIQGGDGGQKDDDGGQKDDDGGLQQGGDGGTRSTDAGQQGGH